MSTSPGGWTNVLNHWGVGGGGERPPWVSGQSALEVIQS